MSADKYPSVFSRQMETIVYIYLKKNYKELTFVCSLVAMGW